MEVQTTSQDGHVLGFVDRGEWFVAKRSARVKRATLLHGRDVQGAPPVFLVQFMPTFSLIPSTTSEEDASSADISDVGRIVSSEDHTRAVGSERTSSLSVESSGLRSSLDGGPSAQYAPTSGDLHTTAEATEDKSGVGDVHEHSLRGQESSDDRQYVMQDGERGVHMDTWTDTQLTQDSLSVQQQQQHPEDILEADDKPLIGNEAAEDGNEATGNENEATPVDQENIDPNNMPLSSLFKITKGKKKSKKNKGKDVAETNATDDVTSTKEAQAEEQTPTAASPLASDVVGTSPSDDVIKTEEEIKMADKVEGEQERRGNDVSGEQIQANSSDSKTDVTSGPQDSAAVLHTTTESRDVTLTVGGEGPQLTPEQGGAAVEDGGVVEAQPAKADGSLPPESGGREKQSLLHDHNPEGMICCTIL